MCIYITRGKKENSFTLSNEGFVAYSSERLSPSNAAQPTCSRNAIRDLLLLNRSLDG